MKRRIAPVVASLMLCAAALSAQQPAQQPAPLTTIDRQVQEISAQLRCPVCQGTSLKDSPSELAQQMRDVIRSQLEQGKTPAQVRQYFISKYGEWILLQPEAKGFNLLVYLLPVLGLLGGALIVFGAVRRWTAAPDEETLAEAEHQV
ncbi:MAG: cytochrome c-type biogenesis protein CcmH [Gemmatimonadota bacterium]|jgi:cytochrome c-type biogenesis protein CcmH